MEVRTHRRLARELCGVPVEVASGRAVVELEATAAMAADERGLVHGGFVFGLADHAAMLAVNQPNVVLVAADSRFLKPVQPGDRLRAEASVTEAAAPRFTVSCAVTRGGEPVFEGRFVCHVPRRHVLDRGPA